LLTAERSRAVELELGRAALALDDLTGACGARAGWRGQTLELVAVGPLLADSVEAWRPAARSRELRLDVPHGFSGLVAGSRVRLAQATGNLLANAIEHGAGTIDVQARIVERQVRVEVLDGGGGLPATVAELSGRRRSRRHLQVGGRGKRISAQTERGNGLAIATAVAAAHGGRLFSAPSRRGARIVLELPLAEGARGMPLTGGEPLGAPNPD
jgi:signal transduction histidine kinase